MSDATLRLSMSAFVRRLGGVCGLCNRIRLAAVPLMEPFNDARKGWDCLHRWPCSVGRSMDLLPINHLLLGVTEKSFIWYHNVKNTNYQRRSNEE